MLHFCILLNHYCVYKTYIVFNTYSNAKTYILFNAYSIKNVMTTNLLLQYEFILVLTFEQNSWTLLNIQSLNIFYTNKQ